MFGGAEYDLSITNTNVQKIDLRQNWIDRHTERSEGMGRGAESAGGGR